VAEFNGYNYNELAKKYGLTSVMIRNIIREKIRETGRTPQPEQMSLFDPPE
jgi:mor transcription activator family